MRTPQGQFDVLAEIEACERIWMLDDAKINAELKRAGVDPDGLLDRLEAALCLPRQRIAHTSERQPKPVAIAGPAAGSSVGAASHDRGREAANGHAPSASFAGPTIEVAGKMKFFDAIKGYGFFAADGEKGDVLVHISHLHAAGHRTIYEGARIHALVHRTAKGLQVSQILSVDESCSVHPSQLPQRTREKVQAESLWVEAVVKWYNGTQGYGFVVERDSSFDCFVHADVLRRWGMAPLWAGQVVEIRWGTGSKGRMVAEIRHAGATSTLPAMH